MFRQADAHQFHMSWMKSSSFSNGTIGWLLS